MKPTLYICGDSWTDWALPEIHWIDYLNNHYNIVKLGKTGVDNTSIIHQIGNIPTYNDNDRILIVFSAPGRLPRRYYGELKEYHSKSVFLSYKSYKDSDFANALDTLKLLETDRWIKGERIMEISFYKKMKELLSQWNPIFVTWSVPFYEKTSEFVELIEVSSLSDETGKGNDGHPGEKGCYEFYIKVLNLLDSKETPIEFLKSKKNRII